VRLLNLLWHRFEWPPVERLAHGAFDVTHSMHPLLMPAAAAAQVVTIHDLNFMHHPERTRAEIRRDYPVLARAHAHRADQVIAVSEFTARETERLFGLDRSRITVCSPGAPDWTPRQVSPDPGYLLFFGTLEPRKNLGALLDAYETLLARRSGVPELVLAGKATEQSAPWLERIARPPLAPHVRHIGYVRAQDRRQLYDGARLLAQPSFEEGFGLTVLEAMAAGVPVVAADRGALPEVLGGAGVLVDTADRDEFAAGLARVLDDPARASAMSAAGATRASHYTWGRMADRTLEAYEAAIARRASDKGRG
jgi:alpha-1,3-rhamnosyl/mannosyltransferase